MLYLKEIRTAAVLGSLMLAMSSVKANSFNPNCYGWYFDIEPFYARLTDSLLTNSIVAVKVADPEIQGDFKQLYHLDLRGAWAYRFAVGYDLPAHDLNSYGASLEYTLYNHSDFATIINDSRNHTGLPVLAPAEFIDITDEASARFSQVHAKLRTRYETADLLAHKNIALNPCLKIKLIAGFRYLHLKEKLNNRYEFSGSIEDIPRVINQYQVAFDNDLNAIGPQIGTAVSYRLFDNFAIRGQIAGAFLYGEANSQFNNHYHLAPSSTLGEATTLSSSNHIEDTAHALPALSGKIGISYCLPLRCCSTMLFEAGYRGEKYFKAIHDVAYQQLLAGDDINSSSNYQDFVVSGPYLSVSYHM